MRISDVVQQSKLPEFTNHDVTFSLNVAGCSYGFASYIDQLRVARKKCISRLSSRPAHQESLVPEKQSSFRVMGPTGIRVFRVCISNPCRKWNPSGYVAKAHVLAPT